MTTKMDVEDCASKLEFAQAAEESEFYIPNMLEKGRLHKGCHFPRWVIKYNCQYIAIWSSTSCTVNVYVKFVREFKKLGPYPTNQRPITANTHRPPPWP